MNSPFPLFSDQYLRSLPMPELRKDPIVGRWVIIATDRARRPLPLPVPPHQGGWCCLAAADASKCP